MCSINVCGIQSKLKYKVLQEYITKFEFICLTETKCDMITDDEIIGYKPFVLQKLNKCHRYGGIHGVCVFVKDCNVLYYSQC